MDLPTTTVAVFEDNETRAELYDLWLEECDVRVGLTPRQATDRLDRNVGVVVLDEGFADGAASKLLECVRARAPAARVIGTRDRGAAYPALDCEEHLAKPVFEDDLVPLVKRLLHRVNYRVALTRYYETTSTMTAIERSDEATVDDDRYDRLDRRATFLRELLAATRAALSESDVAAVLEAATVSPAFADRDDAGGGSKYRPEECINCGVPWGGRPGPTSNYTRLAAFVWRCGECGDVAMISDPSHQRLGTYRI